MKHILFALVAAVLSAALPASAHAQSQSPGFVVVVNSANPVKSLPKDQLSNFFLKKITKWSTDKPVVPVNQNRDNKVRETFSKVIHGRSASAIESYWQQQIFSGKDIPPSSKDNDIEVLAFVRGNANAIGYVAPGTALGDSVKAISVSGL